MLLSINKSKLDISSVQLDGSHTPAERVGEAVAYQNRKKSKTKNAMFLTDKQGIPLSIFDPIDGNHNAIKYKKLINLFKVQFTLLSTFN